MTDFIGLIAAVSVVSFILVLLLVKGFKDLDDEQSSILYLIHDDKQNIADLQHRVSDLEKEQEFYRMRGDKHD